MFSLALDYFLLVVFATVGLLQAAAALSGLDGMQLLANRRATGVLGAAILCGAFIWFTLTGAPSIPGDIGGVEGAEQFGLFWGGLAAAVLGTYTLASVVRRDGRVASRVPPSIEAFRSGTLLALLRNRLSGTSEREGGDDA